MKCIFLAYKNSSITLLVILCITLLTACGGSDSGTEGKKIAAHLKGAKENDVSGLLNATEFSKLHTATENSNYALGWVVTDSSLWHNGSNTKWLADIKIFPGTNTALFIVTNAVDFKKEKNSKALRAVMELTEQLIQRADTAFTH